MSKPPPFVAFDPHKATCIYRVHLPRWRQKCVTYFVTFRLEDSLPAEILVQWKMARRRWLESHGISWDADGRWKLPFLQLRQEEQRSFQTRFSYAIQQHLDNGYGSCLLWQPALRAFVDDAFPYFHTSRFWLGDYVCMPDHCHALMTPIETQDLEDILGSIRSFSARRINQKIGRTGEALWQKEGYDHIVRDLEQLNAFRRYIAENPVRAKLREGKFTYRRADWMDTWI